jgi:hypothetical protein
METNILLENLYKSKWEEISDTLLSFNEEEPEDTENLATHPLLIKIDEEYEKADLKIMFFGQETNLWCGEFNQGIFGYDIEIEDILGIYQDFYLNKGYESYGKPFWNYIKKLKSHSSTNDLQKIGFVWNNVLKIGKVEVGKPQQGLLNKTLEHFDIIPQEIEILKPNVILFFCGHGYDNFIRERVGDFSVESIGKFDVQELCKLTFIKTPVKFALRTYHPSYLQRLPEEKRNNIFNAIINILKEK